MQFRAIKLIPQIKSEIKNALEFMKHVYGIFGFEFSLELSTRPEKFLGEQSLWDKAEKVITSSTIC
jgi:threonyl-tRNA synthetase